MEKSFPQYDADVRIVALSADGEDGAREMASDENLSFPILYGLDVDDMYERLGLYIEKGEKTHLQPAQFVLDPAGASGSLPTRADPSAGSARPRRWA